MKKAGFLFSFVILLNLQSFSQVDTSFIYNNTMPYGTLDLRIAKSDIRYYYLQEDVTFSFRESSPGVRTNTYTDMTSWDSSPYDEGNLREKNGTEDNFVMNYRLLKPQGYNPSYAKGYPIIILMHGSGERANCWNSDCYHATTAYNPNENNPPAPKNADFELLNNDHNLLHGGRTYLDAVNLAGKKLPDDATLPPGAFPGFALFPQSLNGWSGDAVQDAIRIVRLLVKKYNIDEDRIYITGLSNGAHGVFEALKRAPWMFASTIAMSPVDDGFITNVNMEAAVAGIPMWIFQGALDENPYPKETENFIKKFRDAGAVIRYTKYEDVGHTTWNKAFKEPDYMPWLLGHDKSSIHAFAGSSTICNTSGAGLVLELAEGFLAYQWQKNGQTISGANTAKYTATSSGKYRARFSRVSTTPAEADWNEWSDEITVTLQTPPVAQIRQVGTLLLPDLNNANEARLEAVGEFAHYYWYKNGTLMDLPGDQDDTVRFITITAGACNGTCAGNGTYTLVTSNFDNCRSAPTAGKVVVFNNQAALNVALPTGFAGKAESASSVSLKWKDNANNETGYEIWRRKKLDGTNYSLWVMETLTAAGATSYLDTELDPVGTYEYKIRGVAAGARSEYSPTVVVSTTQDSEVPQAPLNVKITRTGLDRVLVTWDKATDDSRIAGYTLAYELGTVSTGEQDTFAIISDLPVNTTYTFNVTATDVAGNVSAESADASIFTGVYGLYYEHSPGYWSSLDSIDYSRPEYTGFTNNFNISLTTQDDYFYFRFDGYLYITTPGSYTFRTRSDNGSRLFLGGAKIVNNDGLHSLATVTSAAKTLAEGPHRITVDFFDYSEADSLAVEYMGPDTKNVWIAIPSAALKSTLIVAAEPDVPNDFTVEVFPNPADQNDINVKVETRNQLLHISVALIDPMGKNVLTESFSGEQLRDGVKLSTSGRLSTGIYFIRVVQGNTVVQQKVVITR